MTPRDEPDRVASPVSDAVDRLHEAIDEAAASIAARHGPRLRCRRGCSGCCVDDLTVFEVEAAAIVRHHPDVLEQAPHPAGACAFLDAQGACRVYASRPYVCRTQGLPLRWLEDDGCERRDICALNEEGDPPIEALAATACWPIGPVETKLAALQAKVDGGALRRVSLRSLFGTPRRGA
ncbi:MAG: YkgJ family cysteine cluster protein [Deltaproteobacteria bacterium]|nr:YkgJ family cysteine cluster protein [Deltaproteobacteria bacterium]